MSEIGHNSVDQVARDQLRAFVERVERLEEEKAGISDDIKEVYAEAKGNGFDVKIMRKLIARRKRNASELAEEEALLGLYETALGPLVDTPLGQAALASAAPRASRPAARQLDLEEAISRLGTPVAPTDKEKAKGVVAAFEKAGTRMSIAIPPIPDELRRTPKREPVDA